LVLCRLAYLDIIAGRDQQAKDKFALLCHLPLAVADASRFHRIARKFIQAGRLIEAASLLSACARLEEERLRPYLPPLRARKCRSSGLSDILIDYADVCDRLDRHDEAVALRERAHSIREFEAFVPDETFYTDCE
jgi:hypothetical protein